MERILPLFTPFAVQVGATCMALQLLLAGLFHNSKSDTPWKKLPMFTAHQIVVIPVLLFLSLGGIVEWSRQLRYDDVSQTDRVMEARNLYFSEFVFGMMLFWDLPTCLLSRELRDPAMIAHHIGMLFVSAVALGVMSNGHPLLGYYAPFFFGLIEISSLPLILVDLFHPKHKEWHAHLATNASPALVKLNDSFRVLFAFLFLALRFLYFPIITGAGVIPDLMASRGVHAEIPNLPLYFLVVTNVLFSMLQLYWGSLIIKTILKVLKKGGSTKSKDS